MPDLDDHLTSRSVYTHRHGAYDLTVVCDESLSPGRVGQTRLLVELQGLKVVELELTAEQHLELLAALREARVPF